MLLLRTSLIFQGTFRAQILSKDDMTERSDLMTMLCGVLQVSFLPSELAFMTTRRPAYLL